VTTLQPGMQRDAADAQTEPVPSDAEGSSADNTSSAPIAPNAATSQAVPAVSARPWVKRDPATGLFTSGESADPAVRSRVETFAAGLTEALGSDPGVVKRALAEQAVTAYGIVTRLTADVERNGVASRAGRVRSVIRELDRWQEKFVELLAGLDLDKESLDPRARFEARLNQIRALHGGGD
jgi:hypothetical protein